MQTGLMTTLKKVKAWDKKTAGHTCNQDPINSVCMKGTCLKRKFGIASDRQLKWPLLSGLTKINYKPNPEWFFTVEKTDESVQVHAKDVYKIESQKALRALLMEQAHIVPPSIKGNEFDAVLKGLFEMKDIDIIEPASGTNPLDILHKHLQDYINGVQPTSHNSFKNGGVLKDELKKGIKSFLESIKKERHMGTGPAFILMEKRNTKANTSWVFKQESGITMI